MPRNLPTIPDSRDIVIRYIAMNYMAKKLLQWEKCTKIFDYVGENHVID